MSKVFVLAEEDFLEFDEYLETLSVVRHNEIHKTFQNVRFIKNVEDLSQFVSVMRAIAPAIKRGGTICFDRDSHTLSVKNKSGWDYVYENVAFIDSEKDFGIFSHIVHTLTINGWNGQFSFIAKTHPTLQLGFNIDKAVSV